MQLVSKGVVFRDKTNAKIMKKSIFILFILATANSTFAQEKEYQTIFDNQDLRISGLGGPFMQFTSVAGEFAFMIGGGGAVLLDNFFIGGYGLGLANTIPDYVNDNTSDRLTLGHGGFWLGYALFGEKPIHVTVSSMIGWGEFGVMQYNEDYPFVRDNIFIIAPTVEVELNLTRYFRIGAGATYNIYTMMDENLHGYTNSDISSAGGFLSFKLGWF
jgi:hypothetical protein